MIAWEGKWYITASVLKSMGIDLRAMEREIENDPDALKSVADQIDIIQRHLDAHLLIKGKQFQLFLPNLDQLYGFRIVRSGTCWEESRGDEMVLAYEANDGEQSHFYKHGQTLVDDSSPFRFQKEPSSFLTRKKSSGFTNTASLPHNLSEDEFDLLMATFFPIQEGFEEMDVAIEDDIRGRLLDEKIPIPDDLGELIESRIEQLSEKYAQEAGKILLREIEDTNIESMLAFANSDAGDALRNTRYFNSGQLRLNGERFYLDLMDETLSLIAVKFRHK